MWSVEAYQTYAVVIDVEDSKIGGRETREACFLVQLASILLCVPQVKRKNNEEHLKGTLGNKRIAGGMVSQHPTHHCYGERSCHTCNTTLLTTLTLIITFLIRPGTKQGA